MKKPSSWLNNLQNKHFLITWLIFHLGLFAFFGITALATKGNIQIDADLLNMFPASYAQESIKEADEKLTDTTSKNVFILVSNKDFSTAKNIAAEVYDKLKDSTKFSSITLYNDMSTVGEIMDYLYKYRWNLLDDETIDLINSPGGVEKISQEALAQVYGAFTMTSLDNLDTDPFMLTERNLNNYLNKLQNSGTAMSIKDGVLASQKNDKWYVMIRGVLSPEGAALASKGNAVVEIHNVCDPYEKDGTKFVYSGTPFHSHKSSTSASREITIISTISMLAVIVILFLVFKNPTPIIYSVSAILLSIATALVSTLAIFHKIHVLTLVFGTSLIGSCIDYSLHFFINWKANLKLNSGKQIRLTMMKELSLSLASTVLCFAILCFAPYQILKQMSVFSMIGLISSYLTVISIYPFIPFEKEESRGINSIQIMKTPSWYNKKKVGRVVITGFFVLSILFILIFHKNASIKNDLNSLYTMEGRELDDELEAGTVIQYTLTGWFIVKADSSEDVLVKEENLIKQIEKTNAETGNTSGYIGTSMFIPSIAHQKKSREAAKKLLSAAPEQFYYLGYEENMTDDLIRDFEKTENDFVSFEAGNIPEFILTSISSAWIGEIDGSTYSVVMPSLVTDSDSFRKLAADDNDIYFISKMEDISRDLDVLTKMILKFFIAAYVIMFIMLKFFYKMKHAAKIISIPILVMLVIYAVFSVAKIHLEFFSIVGMILVLGLGLDYIIYMMENEKRKGTEDAILEPFAIMLSFVTTVISFGALSLSSFKPVHLIGLSIFIGLITAYLSSVFYDRS